MEQESGNPATSSGAGGTETKKYATANATKFELIGPGTATVTRGLDGVINLSAPASDLEHLEVKLDGDTLKVVFRGGLVRKRGPEGPLRYDLSVSVLEELKLSGGLVAEATNIEGRDLKVELKEGSTLTLDQLRVNEFEAKVEGGSRLNATGTVARQKVKLSDKSIYSGDRLECEEAEIEAAGASEATVRVGKKLKVKATGGSAVAYSGQKVDLNVQTSDGSELRRMNG